MKRGPDDDPTGDIRVTMRDLVRVERGNFRYRRKAALALVLALVALAAAGVAILIAWRLG